MAIRHKWLVPVALVVALGLSACEREDTEDRSPPDVEGGNTPEYGADSPEVEVIREK